MCDMCNTDGYNANHTFKIQAHLNQCTLYT